MICTRCDGTGFLNLHQVDQETMSRFEETGDHQIILDWIDEMDAKAAREESCTCHIHPRFVPCCYCELQHDVQVCDCCGDSEDWHSEPGYHDRDNPNDPAECC